MSRWFQIAAFFISFCFFLHADLEKHFKKVENKSDFDQIRNIDFLYLINLDERPEKFLDCQIQLSLYGITPYRFSAVNGWELPLEVINDVGVKYESWMSNEKWGTYYLLDSPEMQNEKIQKIGRNYFYNGMTLGAIGIVLSQLSVLQDAYDSGYETIWVMEDDIDILQNPHLISDLIDRLDVLVGKDGWDILFTDPDTKDKMGNYVRCVSYAWRPNYCPPNAKTSAVREEIGSEFLRIGARYGAYSMVVRRSGMEKILEFMKTYQIFLPYDMDMTFPSGIRLFVVKEDFVSTQPTAVTDNGFPYYRQK